MSLLSKQSISKSLETLTKKDFDGHTEFTKMNLEVRLFWLSRMARFLWLAKNSTHPKKK